MGVGGDSVSGGERGVDVLGVLGAVCWRWCCAGDGAWAGDGNGAIAKTVNAAGRWGSRRRRRRGRGRRQGHNKGPKAPREAPGTHVAGGDDETSLLGDEENGGGGSSNHKAAANGSGGRKRSSSWASDHAAYGAEDGDDFDSDDIGYELAEGAFFTNFSSSLPCLCGCGKQHDLPHTPEHGPRSARAQSV